MLLNKDRLFNIAALLILLITCSYLCYQNDLKAQHQVKNVTIQNVRNEKKENYKTVVYYDIPLDFELQDFVREQCLDAGVSFELALSVMKVESDFQYSLVSSTNDYGIMQINKINHDNLKNKLNITDFLDPYDCTTAGIYMLGSLNWCENENQMLMCYNMGTTGAKRKWSQGIYETRYTQKVMKAKKEIGGLKYEVNVLCN